MSDLPPLVQETGSQRQRPSDPSHHHDAIGTSCPFCVIASTYPGISPLSAPGSDLLDPEKLDPPSFVLFSTEHVVAFLDIMPLTRGHVLVAPRKHRVKVGDLSPDESAEIGRMLPLLARSVVRAVFPDIPHDQADYNIVQNNGPGAAQVVPHVHFHIVPRPPIAYKTSHSPSATTTGKPDSTDQAPARKYPPNPQPAGWKRTAILFGRGQREDLDWDEAAVLVESLRACVKAEWETTFPALTGGVEFPTSTSRVPNDGGESSDPAMRRKKGAWKV